MKLGLISDTHGNLHQDVHDLFKGVDVIYHGGDIVDLDIVGELELIAPVHAVYGNCDPAGWGDPRWAGIEPLKIIDEPFGKVVLTHSHMVPDNLRNPAGLAKHFASNKPRLIMYGHTHVQKLEKIDDCWVVNPGAAGKPRFRDVPSVMTATWHESSNEFEYEVHELLWNKRK